MYPLLFEKFAKDFLARELYIHLPFALAKAGRPSFLPYTVRLRRVPQDDIIHGLLNNVKFILRVTLLSGDSHFLRKKAPSLRELSSVARLREWTKYAPLPPSRLRRATSLKEGGFFGPPRAAAPTGVQEVFRFWGRAGACPRRFSKKFSLLQKVYRRFLAFPPRSVV
jgi:hypothetical protein